MTINDTYFGNVEVQENRDEETFYLEKYFWAHSLSKKIYFTVETRTQQATKFQFNTYVFIENNFEQLCQLALEKLEIEFDNETKKIQAEYQVEAFYIPIDTNNAVTFELSFLNKSDGFSRCIVEFERFIPSTISFEA